MQQDPPLAPWPRLAQTWWVYGLGAALVGLYSAGLVVRLRCAFGRCGGPVSRLLDLDAVGGLPRLVTTALFVATAVLAGRAARRASGRSALWWTAIAAIGAVLALAKVISAHSVAKADAAVATLVGSVLLAVTALAVLRWAGRRWGVPATGPVVLALALYAAATLGLDVVTSLVASLQTQVGALSDAAATFVEELGEALTALVLLVTVRWQGAGPGPVPGAGPAPGAEPVEFEPGRTPDARTGLPMRPDQMPGTRHAASDDPEDTAPGPAATRRS
jgi:hypothetical protein